MTTPAVKAIEGRSRDFMKKSIYDSNGDGIVDEASALGMSLEAGEDLVVGDPVYVNANKFYKADNTTNFRVIAIVTVGALLGLAAKAVYSGKITLSGLTANTPYFLGASVITSVCPATGFIVRMGQALSTTEFIVNIEEPILLS